MTVGYNYEKKHFLWTDKGMLVDSRVDLSFLTSLEFDNYVLDRKHDIDEILNNNSITSQILNNTLSNINTENISIFSGEDATITGNSFTNSGTVNNRYTVSLNGIGKLGGTGHRLLFHNKERS